MLLANQTVAGHFNVGDVNNLPSFAYRVHDKPDETKLFEFLQFVKSLGYSFNLKSKNLSKKKKRKLSSYLRGVMPQAKAVPSNGLPNI